MKFLELAKDRYSVRAYSDRPVEKEKLDYVLECARLAPSATNAQLWKLCVDTDSVFPPHGCFAECLADCGSLRIECEDNDASLHRQHSLKVCFIFLC